MQPLHQDNVPDVSDLELEGTEPVTDYSSKKVMLRAEKKDNLIISDVIKSYSLDEKESPQEFQVLRRTQTFYGTKLLLDGDEQIYMLTAPGPDQYLLLWRLEPRTDKENQRWRKIAEVSMEFADELPPYNICPECREPIKNAKHETFSLLGQCSSQS